MKTPTECILGEDSILRFWRVEIAAGNGQLDRPGNWQAKIFFPCFKQNLDH